jgi:hypothetical protein
MNHFVEHGLRSLLFSGFWRGSLGFVTTAFLGEDGKQQQHGQQTHQQVYCPLASRYPICTISEEPDICIEAVEVRKVPAAPIKMSRRNRPMAAAVATICDRSNRNRNCNRSFNKFNFGSNITIGYIKPY